MADPIDNQSLATDLVRELIKERRRDRRWKMFRFLIICLFVIGMIILLSSGMHSSSSGNTKKGYVALVRLNGMIAPGQDFSAENVLPLLDNAFQDREAKGVVLDINSGGGTPVQASIIHDAILKLKTTYHKKVVVVGEDTLASGAYYVAVAADKIIINPNTITGSIGVIMKEFGFPDLIKKIGVERRVFTAGANKDRLDPFLPTNPEDVAKIQQVIAEVHKNFENVVQKGRAGKLHADKEELFSGDFWSGETALKLGLVDGLGNLTDAIETEFKVEAYKDYSQGQSLLKSILGQLSASFDLKFGTLTPPLWTKIH